MPAFRRAAAWSVDFALVVAPASVLAVLTFHRVSALVTDVPELATRGGFDLLTSRGDVAGASGSLGLALWDTSVLYVEQAFGLPVAVTFLHQWACPALFGRTVGKGLTGLRIAPRGPGPAARRAAVTTAADVAVHAVARVLLIEGRFALSVLVWAVAVALFLFNALPVPGPGRRSLADRVAGTSVPSVTGPGLGGPDAARPVRAL
ncbi:RDD family protein [Streptomyces sp. NPDC126497]|uniref:RDD family protein n=1 Tax=Streptomyces sp. NPDC126497 TaxID=3155313 RepID=UPI00332BD1AF